MTENKLRNEVGNILLHDTDWKEVKVGDCNGHEFIYEPALDKLLVLIEDVVCEFAKFYERTSIVYDSPKKAFNHFITHVYKQTNTTV